jgi:CBS domain containing-hemolysin-like protein
MLDGSLPVREINRKYDLNLPEENDYTTLAGFLLWRAGRMLSVSDVVEHENLCFTIESVIRRRIARVKLERIPNAADNDSELTVVDL